MLNNNIFESNKLIFILLIYFILFYFIFSAKPQLLFNKNGTFRDFGAGYNKKTIIPAWFFTILISIGIYISYNFLLLSIKIHNKNSS